MVHQSPGVTRRQAGIDRDSIDAYWHDIEAFRPLSRAREVELIRQARAGDHGALDAVVNANLRFVLSIAREYTGLGLSFGELVCKGNYGLLEALDRFDPTRGFKFITYAVWWIRQAILKALAEYGKAARPPLSQRSDLQKAERRANRLVQVLGRDPTLQELAAASGISTCRLRNALELGQRDLSFDAPLYGDDSDETLLSIFAAAPAAPGADLERSALVEAVESCLNELDPREARILRAYFGLHDQDPLTLEQIGSVCGLTRERVRQLRDRALARIRTRWGRRLLELSEA